MKLIRTLTPALKKPSMVVIKVIESREETVSGGGKENGGIFNKTCQRLRGLRLACLLYQQRQERA